MNIQKLYDQAFDTDTTILAASLAGSEACIFLLSSGQVFQYDFANSTSQHLFSVKSQISYSDGGFDLSAPATIYTLDSIVLVVNDFKRHGFVHYPGHFHSVHLWREDYHADISRYPIALFKGEANIPHLIYGAAWNHLQIMNLETLQILTADKSLIEVSAEENHIARHKKYKEVNKSPWPRPYDYFFGELRMSPNQKKFLSAGWAWGSYDVYISYDVDHFITSNRILGETIDAWEHDNRAVCWIDNDHVVVAVNPYLEQEEEALESDPWEFHFYTMKGALIELDRTIKIKELDLKKASIYYDQTLKGIIAYSEHIGLAVISLQGELCFHQPDIQVDTYCPKTNLFLTRAKKSITVFKIIQDEYETQG